MEPGEIFLLSRFSWFVLSPLLFYLLTSFLSSMIIFPEEKKSLFALEKGMEKKKKFLFIW